MIASSSAPARGGRAARAVRATVARRRLQSRHTLSRLFSTSLPRSKILDASSLPDRIVPRYLQTPTSSLLSLHWPRPLRNVLLTPKFHAPQVLLRTVEFSKHIHANYPGLNLVFERNVAEKIHDSFPYPIHSLVGPSSSEDSVGSDPQHQQLALAGKIDIVTILGGDGTILRAASLFSTENSVPPLLSFSMGSLGFLGEWKFEEYKRAWREAYMSGSSVTAEDLVGPHTQTAAIAGPAAHRGEGAQSSAWDRVRGNGKSMGATRTSKILLRDRLRVAIYDHEGRDVNASLVPTSTPGPDLRLPVSGDSCSGHVAPTRASPSTADRPRGGVSSPCLHAINEVSIDRGSHPHLAIIDIFVNDSFLTEAVADGILISTPTGSTAYSLSAGGSIVHPLVKSLLITPVSPRSLSFRPLVLPLNTKVTLRLSRRNRGRELPVTIDGTRRASVSIGMEVRVEGEISERAALDSKVGGNRSWVGGVPCVMRSTAAEPGGRAEDYDPWVGGLNGLLKFNYPFGEPGDVP